MTCQPVTRSTDLGRGTRATLDMRLRIADLRARRADVIAVLWARHVVASVEGYTYEYAPGEPARRRR